MARRYFTALPFDDHALEPQEWERRAREIDALAALLRRHLPRWQLARWQAPRLRPGARIG